MNRSFRGVVNLDIRDSVPDWAPYEQPKAKPGTPNVVYIVLDDVGFSALSCYGGLIETPNIDRIAAQGLRYTQWHTTALCSPTRSCLLTGRNHTTNGMACITEAAAGFPNGNGHIPPECATVAEMLVERGFSTAMVGKWHLCAEDEMNLASTKRDWPLGRGFERFYGFLGAETNQWYPDLVHDNHPVDPPDSPGGGIPPQRRPDRPRDRVHRRRQDDRARPAGVPVLRPRCRARPAPRSEGVGRPIPRQVRHGLREGRASRSWPGRRRWGSSRRTPNCRRSTRSARPDTRTGPDGKPFPALDYTKPWDSLSADERRLFARMAEVYAGSCRTPTTRSAGCWTTSPRSTSWTTRSSSWCRTTAPAARAARTGRSTRTVMANGMPDDIAQQPGHARRAGQARRRTTTTRPGGRWRSTPRSRCGSDTRTTAAPAIRASSPGRPVSRPAARSATSTTTPSTSSRPCWTASASTEPEDVRGVTQIPVQGVSMRYSFDAATIPTAKKTQFYSMLGTRGIWHDGWKAVTTHPAISGWSHYAQDDWELFHTQVDRSELHDLSAEQPEKLAEMIGLWFYEAGVNHAFPLDDRGPRRDHHHAPATARAPARPLRLPAGRRGGSRGRGGEHPQPLVLDRRRSSIYRGPAHRACIFSHGSRFGGHALYVKDNRLHYVYNFVGITEQHIIATEDVPTGENLILSASFDKDGEDPPGVATGTAQPLPRRLRRSARAASRPSRANSPSPARASTSRCDRGEPVTDDYPGTAAVGVHRRHRAPRRRRRLRRALRRPRTRSGSHAPAGVSRRENQCHFANRYLVRAQSEMRTVSAGLICAARRAGPIVANNEAMKVAPTRAQPDRRPFHRRSTMECVELRALLVHQPGRQRHRARCRAGCPAARRRRSRAGTRGSNAARLHPERTQHADRRAAVRAPLAP